MRARFATLGVIVQIALRNLFASRLKTFIVGGIIFFGAMIVVVGSSLVDSIVSSMSRSVVGSVAGHLQVYSSQSKDVLEVMGGFSLEGSDIEPLDDFAKVRDVLTKVPNVKAVVPMGINGAIVTSGNTIDLALQQLRDVARKRQAGEKSPALDEAYTSAKDHVRQIVTVLDREVANARLINDERALDPSDVEAVRKAASPAFWEGFDADPYGGLEFLENKIAPQATDADMLFLRYVGTDPAAFASSFDRLRIVDGQTIPTGKRGFLFSKFVYEDQLKLKTARRLDKAKEAIEQGGRKIASDLELQRFVRENTTQVREIILQLDARKTALFRQKLQAKLSSKEQEVGKLLSAFFAMDDANFADRYKFFYDELAPSLNLYRIRVGDTLTIKAFTKSGYVQSVNLRVYGTFVFTGLETSELSGALNVMDLVSFRDLYGFLTTERLAELQALKSSVNAKEVSRENAEAELFGEKPTESDTPARTVVADATAGVNAPEGEGLAARLKREELIDRVYDPAELQKGIVLNAAVILHDTKKLDETRRAIEQAGVAAGLPLKAISWQEASGMIGKMVYTMQMVLMVAVLIIFIVALVIINNALVMATLERVQEIGTLRAVGAQRRFVLGMLTIESIAIGLVFGLAGALTGAAIVGAIAKVGIPAFNEVAVFFFSGPRLHPSLATGNLLTALVIVFVVSAISSFYPAFLAMRVTPRQAMQSEE